jgi:predicted TPR repeat methyltransferase
MSSKVTLHQTNVFAPQYDEYIAKTHWFGPQMIFGLMYEYIRPEDNLLDLGIGTGVSAMNFKRAGLKIYGVDGAEEMIRICQKKGIAEDIKQADLVNFKSPYGVAIFEHVISVGVFHLVGDLAAVFSEVARSIRKGGVFGFTFFNYNVELPEEYIMTEQEGIYTHTYEDSGIQVYKHSSQYIDKLLKSNNFRINKATEFLAYRDENSGREYHFEAYIAQKLG